MAAKDNGGAGVGQIQIIFAKRVELAMVTVWQDVANTYTFAGAEAQVDLVVQPSGHELTTADVETAQRWIAAELSS